MVDLIDRKELRDALYEADAVTMQGVKIINQFPAVNAAPVVRCRDCVHWKPTKSKAGNSFSDMEYIGGCEFVYYCLRESDFCSRGKRKDGDGNG